MAFEADLATMFETTEFAEVATIVTPASLAGQTLSGIFDLAYRLIDVETGVESSAPAFALPDSSIPAAMATALQAGDSVSLRLRTVAYGVVEHKPDGTGVTVLRLRK